METFIREAYDLFNMGRNDEEKQWLRDFVDHVQKYICKDDRHLELSLTILEHLTALYKEQKRDDGNDADNNCDSDNDKDDIQQTSVSSICQMLPISALAAKKEICSGQFINFEDEVTSNNAYSQLVPIVPSVLLGYLQWSISALESSGNPECGSMFLEDKSGFLPIEISNPNIKWINQLVIVSSWTFIPAPENFYQNPHNQISSTANGYIEARASCVPVFPKTCSSFECLPLPASMSLTEYQGITRHARKTLLNLHAKVAAVSPVHSGSLSKGDPFFFVELSSQDNDVSTPIVIKGAKFMHWAQFLQIEKIYVFTSLRNTTMNKGTKNQRKILVSTTTTEFYEYQQKCEITKKRKTVPETSYSYSQNIPSKCSKNMDGRPRVPREDTTDQDQSKGRMPKTVQSKRISYKGVITRCYPHPHVGCYELDNKIRLYTVHQPCPRIGRGLRVGADVSLFNVHLVKNGKGVLGLCCCTLSSVRVTKFSSLISEWKPTVLNTSPFALHGQNMTLQEYVAFTRVCEAILNKFAKTKRLSTLIGYFPSRQKSSSEDKPGQQSVIETFLSDRKPSNVSQQPRNIYQEFFDRPHTCCPTRSVAVSLPTIHTIEELKQMVVEKNKEGSWENGALDRSAPCEWLYQIFELEDIAKELVLLGHLRSSSSTGYLRLCDDTGNILLRVTAEQDNPTDQGNQLKTLLDSRDAIVQITKCSIVIEKFQNSMFDADEQRTRMYVQTSVNDLKQLTMDNGRNTFHTKQPNTKEGSSTKELVKSCDHSRTCARKDTTCVFKCEVLFLVRHQENPKLRKKGKAHYSCAVDVKVIGYCTNKTARHNTDVCDVSRMETLSKNVVLRLESASLSWYPYLYDGCFYILKETAPNELKSIVMQSLNSNFKSVLNVSTSMSITLVPHSTDSLIMDVGGKKERNAVAMAMDDAGKRFLTSDDDKLYSIESILDFDSKSSGNISEIRVEQVNFFGRIQSRELRLSDTRGQMLPGNNVLVPHFGALDNSTVNQLQLGFDYLGNKTLFLRLQGLHSLNTMDVYVNLSTTPYIDGLLPGAVISCRRFLRKLSRGGNVYCSFEACSSLTIISSASAKIPVHSSTNTESKVDPANQRMSSIPSRSLADVIQCRKSIHSISRIRCRVKSVEKLWMRWHCSKCHQVIIKEQCPQGCQGVETFRFFAEARCCVEDGTAAAIVYLSHDVVWPLLRLSLDEISRLKTCALMSGELNYQRHSYGHENKVENAGLLSKQAQANKLLADHCCSQETRRSVVLYCKAIHVGNKKACSTAKEYDTRPIRINKTEHSTFVKPRLQVRCVELKDVDYEEEIKQLLCSLKNQIQDP